MRLDRQRRQQRARKRGTRFTQAHARFIQAAAQEMALEEERQLAVELADGSVSIELHMNDTDAIDLYFVGEAGPIDLVLGRLSGP